MKRLIGGSILAVGLVALLVAATPNGAVMSWNGDAGYWGPVTSFPGNAATATALVADPADCSAGQSTIGINASGAAQGCFTPAPVGAGYWVKTADSTLSGEQAMGALATGVVINTTTTGVPTILTAQTCTNQFVRSYSASATATCASVDLSADTAATALPTAKGGTGNTGDPNVGGVAFGIGSPARINTTSAGAFGQTIGWAGTSGTSPSPMAGFYRTSQSGNYTNSTTTPSTIVATSSALTAGTWGIHCVVPNSGTSTASIRLQLQGENLTSYQMVWMKFTTSATAPVWENVAALTTGCTTSCLNATTTTWVGWGKFVTSNTGAVNLQGVSSTSGQSVATYGAWCQYN